VAIKLRVSLRFALAAGTAGAVVLTAAFIHIPWDLTSRANIAELRERLNTQYVDTIGQKADGLLDAAVGARMTIADIIGNGVIDLADAHDHDALFLSFLHGAPAISAIEFGWPDSRAFGVRRAASDAVLVEETTPGAGGPAMRRVRRYAMDTDGGLVLAGEETVESDRPITQQLWFQTAFDAAAPDWSDIYRLPATGKAGVTTAEAVTQGGVLLGVVGVSIELERISAFLDGIDAGPGGTVFLTNIYGELVATQMAKAENLAGPAAVGRLEEAAEPLLQIAVQALAANNLELNEIRERRELAIDDPATGETYFVSFQPLVKMGLIVSIVTAASDLLGDIDRNTRRLLYGVVALIVVIAAATAFVARRTLGNPLVLIGENVRQLEDFRLENVRPVPSRFTEIALLSAAIGRMSASLGSFRKYIPTDVVRMLFDAGIEAELGGERRQLTLLFMDIAGFTRISETLGQGIIPLLGDYLSEMSGAIQRQQGTIDKYIGDAIMAFWGAPMADERQAERACRAALACQARLRELRLTTAGGDRPPLFARIGLNTGTVLVGNFGSRERLNYTAIGDPVNVASRLEALNKEYGTEIMIGEATYAEAKDVVVARRLDRVAVYGKVQGIGVYELVGLAGEVDAATLAWVGAYEEGLAAFRRRLWDEAIALFERAVALRGDDRPSRALIERARAFKAEPPPADWDGIAVLTRK